MSTKSSAVLPWLEMPRIKAATVPEHREAQREALLSAAKAIIVRNGVPALTFSDLADRAHVARPSVYDYFRTKPDLLIALVDAEFPPWRDEIVAAMSSCTTPAEQVEAFVRAQLRLVADGRHELPYALSKGDLDPKVMRHVAKIHEAISQLLTEAVRALGVRDIPTAMALVTGVVRTGADLVAARPQEAPRTIDTTSTFVRGALATLTKAPMSARPGGAAVPRKRSASTS